MRLALVALAVLISTSAALADASNWSYRQSKDPNHGLVSDIFETAVNAPSGDYRLQLVCIGINWPIMSACFPVSIAQPSAPVQIIIALDGSPSELMLFHSFKNNPKGAFVQLKQMTDVIERLAAGKVGRVSTETTDGQPIAFNFDASSLGSVLAPYRERCKLP